MPASSVSSTRRSGRPRSAAAAGPSENTGTGHGMDSAWPWGHGVRRRRRSTAAAAARPAPSVVGAAPPLCSPRLLPPRCHPDPFTIEVPLLQKPAYFGVGAAAGSGFASQVAAEWRAREAVNSYTGSRRAESDRERSTSGGHSGPAAGRRSTPGPIATRPNQLDSEVAPAIAII